jgi:hypothetical protein
VSRARSGAALAAAGCLIGALGWSHLGAIARVAAGVSVAGRASAAVPADSPGPLPTGTDSFEAVLGMPATDVAMIGVSSASTEAGEEVWAYGTLGSVPALVAGKPYAQQLTLLEHTEAAGWQVVPLPPGPGGAPLSSGSGNLPDALHGLGGRVTAAGGVVLLTDAGIVARDPQGQAQVLPEPEATLLGEHESLPPQSPPAGAGTPYAAIEDEAGHTGVLIAPDGDGSSLNLAAGILHYDGVHWTREPISQPEGLRAGFTPEALACGAGSTDSSATSPQECWLLAAYKSAANASSPDRLALFRRTPTESHGYAWKQQTVADQLLGEASELLGNASSEPLLVTPPGAEGSTQDAQMLTVTSHGVWVDFKTRFGGSTADVSKLVIPPEPSGSESSGSSASSARTEGTWCYPLEAGPTSVCAQLQPQPQSLGAPLPATYQSFAWPAASGPGTRIITGFGNREMLELSGGGDFTYVVGAGGSNSGEDSTVFSSPQNGWIGVGGAGFRTPDQAGQSQVIHITERPQGDQLQETAVPFRYPLLAVAQAPGSEPGNAGAQAVAVGLQGEVGRYTPGQGWSPESLYDATGKVQTPTLRGVAWPEPGRAYAVGDNGAMWLWRADTGLWEPDPAKPLNLVDNLTAIAFSSESPTVGYAVGKDGTLLSFGKSWTQVPLPADLAQANFTSVTFAGNEALATYRTVTRNPEVETGGLAVEDGSGWHIDPGASSLLAETSSPADTVLSKVVGLPDGGAVAAGPGLVIERDSPSASWRFSSQPLPEAQNVSALGAYRDPSGVVRAVISIDLDSYLNPNIGNGNLQTGPWSGDVPAPTGPGQPPPFAPADPLPNTGYVLKETSAGWSDMEHMALEAPTAEANGENADMPVRPDPALALLVGPGGNAGLAVGGQTYDATGSNNGSSVGARSVGSGPEFETAAVMRFGPGASSSTGDAAAPIATTAADATFAVGGEAACERACADFAGEGLAPDVGLTHALQSAAQIASGSAGGLRGFLYTGGRLRAPAASSEILSRELKRYESLLGSETSLPARIAASPGDLAPGGGGIGQFASILAPFLPGAGGNGYYSFQSTGAAGGPVTVIVLDYSGGELGPVQRAWLSGELQQAKAMQQPAIVMGNASLGFTLPQAVGEDPPPLLATDAAAVAEILVQGGASAYLFDYPGVDVQAQVSLGANHIPAFGTGTLGYVSSPGPFLSDSLGSSGFLLLDVDTSARNPATNVAPVTARVEPNISQLALDASDGVLLRRSRVALLEALARRAPSGVAIDLSPQGSVGLLGPDPYDPIPFDCQGPNCADALPVDYAFSSSNPDVGDFVAHDPTSANPRQVELGPNGLPVPDSQSGLFCAFNSGTTTVSITTGGLVYSEQVTVQAGSVEYPCGTVPLKHPPATEAPERTSFTAPELPPTSSPAPVSPKIQTLVPPPPPAAPEPHRPPVRPPAAAAIAFVPLAQPLLGARGAIVPPPPPSVARPIPPSGTSQVSQTMGVPEEEREEESATEMAASTFSAYDAHAQHGPGPWVLVLIVLAAAAGAGIRRGGGSSSRERPALAMASSRHRGNRH